jgi:two-component system KDP operon response regulator KdpE
VITREHCVLVIEDDARYRELLELNLRRRGHRVLLAPDGLTGLNLLERDTVDLIILDLMLPDLDGYQLCQRVREYSAVPIIILSAKAEEGHKVRGLHLGADDYVTKPFGAAELVARIEAVLRRNRYVPEVIAPRYANGDLEVDLGGHRVTVGGKEVHLTPHEYKLLYHLARNPGRIMVQDELLRRVWGVGYESQAELLHTTVRRLRRKIEADPSSPRHLLTRRGIGYLLAQPETSES